MLNNTKVPLIFFSTLSVNYIADNQNIFDSKV